VKSQWDCVLQNLGQWQGSFTNLSPYGEIVGEIPSEITLTGLNQNQAIHLLLRRFYPEAGSDQLQPRDLVREFSSPGAGTVFFDSGAFSEGMTYWSSYGPFATEFAFVAPSNDSAMGEKAGDRRMRLVQQFATGGQIERFTLIREHRFGTAEPERPPLTPAEWDGVWQGVADEKVVDGAMGVGATDRVKWETVENVYAPMRRWMGGGQRYQALFLPDGAYCCCPNPIAPGQPFTLEVGWLLGPGQRQRLIRQYDQYGNWARSLWLQETRQPS
jgi:hypothetical protein